MGHIVKGAISHQRRPVKTRQVRTTVASLYFIRCRGLHLVFHYLSWLWKTTKRLHTKRKNVGVEVTYDVPPWYGRPLGPEEVRLWMSAKINRGSGKKVQVLGAINPVKQWHSLLKVLAGFFSVPRGLSRAFGSISRSFRATPLTSSVIIIICGPSHPLWGRIESQHV